MPVPVPVPVPGRRSLLLIAALALTACADGSDESPPPDDAALVISVAGESSVVLYRVDDTVELWRSYGPGPASGPIGRLTSASEANIASACDLDPPESTDPHAPCSVVDDWDLIVVRDGCEPSELHWCAGRPDALPPEFAELQAFIEQLFEDASACGDTELFTPAPDCVPF